MRRGMALIPENRKTLGLALTCSVGDNIVLAGLGKLFPSGFFIPRRAMKAARAVSLKSLRIATPTPRRPVATLSGGNQQKVVIGKWLNADARFYIFDEPTRGIDVGTKAEIFRLLDGLVHNGAAILMISSEQIEIVHICDRAEGMRSGRIVGELSHHEAHRSQYRSPRDTLMNTRRLSPLSISIARVPGVAIVLVVLCAVFGTTSPGFATPANVANILTQSTILLLLALPMTVIIMTEGLDLSIGAVLTFASIVLAVTVVTTGSPTLAFLAALAVGIVLWPWERRRQSRCSASRHLSPRLAHSGPGQGLSLVVTDGQSVVGIPHSIENIYSGTAAGIPFPVIVAALAYSITHALLYHTRFGTYVFALGGNLGGLESCLDFRERHADPSLTFLAA